jgi:hypothetical protein
MQNPIQPQKLKEVVLILLYSFSQHIEEENRRKI